MSAQGSGPAQGVRVQVGERVEFTWGAAWVEARRKGSICTGWEPGFSHQRSSRYGKSANEDEPLWSWIGVEYLDWTNILCLLLLQILL